MRPKIDEKSKILPPTVHFLTFTPTVAVTVCIRALSSTMLSQQYCVAPLKNVTKVDYTMAMKYTVKMQVP